MVRIRHIMEMRRACKAPPLLPPKLRKEGSESTDRRDSKDVMDLTFRVNTLAPERYPSSSFYLHLYESQDSPEGPWNLITETDRLGTNDTAVLEDFLAIEFSFERLQWFKMEISELSENGVKVFKVSEIFSIAQICAGPIIFPMVDQSGHRVSGVEIWSQLRERTQPIVMQLEAKNLSTKLVSSNSNLSENGNFGMARFNLEIRSMGADNVDFCICSCSMFLSVFDDRESAKVAEALLNPLGEDDDDFECNWLIDRNISTGIEIIDTCHDSCPPLKLEEPDDEKGTMYWCHPTKNGSQAPAHCSCNLSTQESIRESAEYDTPDDT
ncbi:hypothetical protein GCK72_012661 [Caenorhabditis remanei]|uniref:Bestrophin homolog n=1 Tax=Caenorhabditis remanei TaxID=31234 RepID=A0A6A5GLK7_CAERE|nr:hypothetical protein GCK72_012661 [Caenorhabditis remanei]KAF1756208.1 hypothetical protein GCK72_012661 [Caenorhabditis remanei]